MAGPNSLLTEPLDVLTSESGIVLEAEYYADFFGPDARFIIVELDVYKPGNVVIGAIAESHLSHPHLALAEFADSTEVTAQILASDLGYRKAPTDVGGIVAYPPIVEEAFQIDNKVNLDPQNSGVAASWGAIVLSDANDQFDAIASTYNSDGRNIRILTGLKTFDRGRQYHVDPAYASLALLWAGVATPWFLSDTALTVPVRDATYWLERPYQTLLYGGTGTYEGTAALTGKPKPRTRGGTATDPVRNVTPTLVDPVNRIYQYNDGPGTVVNLYEGAATVIARSGDTTNLYAGSTPAGQFRTDNSRGLFQLGSVNVHAITVDVTGAFPIAGAQTTFAAIARYMLTEDLLLPAANIDIASFTAADSAFPYVSGIYFDSNSTPTGVDAITRVLSGPGAKLVAKRGGTLGLFVLRTLPATASPVAAWDLSTITQITPIALPSTLDPPPYRIRSEYMHNYTGQTSDLNNASATPAQVQFVGVTGNFATFSSTDILTAFRRPNDMAPVTGPLLRLADAQTVVNDLGALWCVRRRLYDVSVPAWQYVARDFGDVVSIRYPMDDLTAGRLGQIVGYSFRSVDAMTIFRVLV